jgi:hypothetical protein
VLKQVDSNWVGSRIGRGSYFPFVLMDGFYASSITLSLMQYTSLV